MGGMFKSKQPVAAVQAATTAPEVKPDSATVAAAPMPQEQVDQLSASVRRKRKGMASTITGASEGSSTAGSVASKTLLGM